MDKKEMGKKLGSLVQLDIDAVHAYSQAIEKIDHSGIREQLVAFRGDHERHITELSGVIRDLGETPPEYSRDFKGFLIEGFTALRSATGTEGALKAMRGNEKLTNRKYDEAVAWGLPPEAKSLVEKNLADEKRHLAYIENALTNRTWEKQATHTR